MCNLEKIAKILNHLSFEMAHARLPIQRVSSPPDGLPKSQRFAAARPADFGDDDCRLITCFQSFDRYRSRLKKGRLDDPHHPGHQVDASRTVSNARATKPRSYG